MAGGTKKQIEAAEVDASFPCNNLLDHPAWKILDSAISELESNSDLELQTARRYVVGFLVSQLVDGQAIPPPYPAGVTTDQQKHLSWRLIYEIATPKRRARRALAAR